MLRELPVGTEQGMAGHAHSTPFDDGSRDTQGRDIITTHINADFDALASMIAAKKLYPDATLVFPGAQEKNLRNFFLHSTSYLFDFAKLKNIDFSKVRRLILVDTRQKSRIGRFTELVDKPEVELHIFDHHPASEDDLHGTVEHVRKVGSTTALIIDIIRTKHIPVTPDEATVMCLGIHEDTGSFTFSSTTAEDYDAASWLTRRGANHNIIADMLTRELTAEQVWLLNDLTQAAATRIINGVEVVISKVIRDEYVGDFAVLAHKLMEMENLDVLFALGQMEDRIHVVARSRIPEVNVAEIALELGGGGHPEAASATVKGKTLIQVERSLISLLRSSIQPTKRAKDLMASPVIHISPDETLKAATNLMTRYNINVLLVMDEHNRLQGYVTRQIVLKAVYFGLEHLKVHEYMNIEFATVHPDTPLKKVQELIIRNKLRILPVVEDERVLGVITRTDLLTILLGEPVVPEFLYDAKRDSQLMRKKNMAALLRERLPEDLVALLKNLGRVADTLGYSVYLVGGLVRDVFLMRENLDVDIVVEEDGIKFAHEFGALHGARVKSHRKFGTAMLIFPDGFKVDVATARMEYYESPGALPVVETSSLKLDLYRRDFTINTLAIKLNRKEYGTLIDYFGGLKDIKAKVLRVLHNLSFVEDPTRVLRAVRFEQRFGFKIGRLTMSLIKNAVKINTFKDIGSRRLFLELKLILMEKNPIKAIRRMNELELFQFIHGDIVINEKTEALLEEIRRVVAWYHLLFLEGRFEPWRVYWNGITSELDMQGLDALSDRMGMSETDTRRMITQRTSMGDTLDALYKFAGSNYELYTILLPYDTETLLYLMAKTGSERIKRLVSGFFTKLKGVKFLLMGRDLIEMGYQPGPTFKGIFERLLEARMNNVVKTRQDEMMFVRQTFPTPSS